MQGGRLAISHQGLDQNHFSLEVLATQAQAWGAGSLSATWTSLFTACSESQTKKEKMRAAKHTQTLRPNHGDIVAGCLVKEIVTFLCNWYSSPCCNLLVSARERQRITVFEGLPEPPAFLQHHSYQATSSCFVWLPQSPE